MSTSLRTRTRSRHTIQTGKSDITVKSESNVGTTAENTKTSSVRKSSRLLDLTNQKESVATLRQRKSRSRTRSAREKLRDQSKTVEDTTRKSARPLGKSNKENPMDIPDHKRSNQVKHVEANVRPSRLRKPTEITKEFWENLRTLEIRRNKKKVESDKPNKSPREKPLSAQKSPEMSRPVRSGGTEKLAQSTASRKERVPKILQKPLNFDKTPEKETGNKSTMDSTARKRALRPLKTRMQDEPAKETKSKSPLKQKAKNVKPVAKETTVESTTKKRGKVAEKDTESPTLSRKKQESIESKTSNSQTKMKTPKSLEKDLSSRHEQILSQIPQGELLLKDFSIVLERSNFDESLLGTPVHQMKNVEAKEIGSHKTDKTITTNLRIKTLEKSISAMPAGGKSKNDSKVSPKSAEKVQMKECSIVMKKVPPIQSPLKKSSSATLNSKKSVSIKESAPHKRNDNLPSSPAVRKSMKRPLSPSEKLVKPAAKKRVVIQSPTKDSIQHILPFRKLIEIEDDIDMDDVYNFRMSQPSYPKNTKRIKAKPVRKLNKNKKTNAGSKLDNLVQQKTLKFASNSCVVMHNPDQFKAEKEKVQKLLQISEKHRIDKVNLVVDVSRKIEVPQRKVLQQQNQSVNTTKSRTPPQTAHRRLNMHSPEPDFNNEENEPILSEAPINPVLDKIKDHAKRPSLVFSPKIVSSPKIIASPFRVNDELKFPRTFYFSLTKDNMPSYSSDPVIVNSNANQENQENANKKARLEEEVQSPVQSENSDLFVTASNILVTEDSMLNHSNMENITPVNNRNVKIAQKSPMKLRNLENPSRSPLKALPIPASTAENNWVPLMQSPLVAFSTSSKEPRNDKIVIISNETVKEAGQLTNSQITEDVSGNRDTSAQNSNAISKSSVECRSSVEVASAKSNENLSDAEDFGFDDLLDENNRDQETLNPSTSHLSLEAIKEKLSKLKQYLPSKQKNTSAESKNKSNESSLVTTNNKLFASPGKQTKDIREMFTSTPNQADALMKHKKKMSFGVDSTRPSLSIVEGASKAQNTVTEEESEVAENSEHPTQIELFDDPTSETTEFMNMHKSYTRKRRLAFLDVTDGNISDLEEEQVERPKKKKRKVNVENTKEFKTFVNQMNSMFEEVDNYEMVIE